MIDQSGGDEISILDLMVVFAENWLLLFLGPLFAAALTYGVMSLTERPSYEALSLLNIDAREAGLLQSASVLENALNKSAFHASNIGSIESVRRDFEAENLRVRKNGDTGFYVVSVKTDEPAHGLEILQLLTDGLIAGTIPSLELQAQIKNRMQRIERSIDLLEVSLAKVLGAADAEQVASGTQGRAAGDVLVAIVTNLEQRRQSLDQLASELRGTFLPDDVLQKPVTTRLPPRGKMTTVVAAAIGVAMLLLVAVFIRDGLSRACRSSRGQDQVNRIRRAFWLPPLADVRKAS
ncbi:hypothetical protein JHL21_16010 [Devosia sp. WQ 349]|uniref:hypothetical protein n=1 Tax=Devosia sp. WQ 349K1 TaxID=2800329 RepID=UPI001905320B|nr:hypothetical protein [Devosia sp. WQ 349K1]MBK1795997.1 hypothetical protein [Devosia sp. WQ 349K1]